MQNERYPKSLQLLIGILIFGLVIQGCNLFSANSQSQALEATRQSIALQLTQQAIEIEFTRPAQIQATLDSQATLVAGQVAELAQQSTQAAMAVASQPVTPQETPSPDVQPTTSNINTSIKAAKILLYENISGQKIYGVYHPRYVQSALERGGYAYTNVGSALGWFRDQLLTGPEWDLIIASSEATNKLQGEYFTYIYDHLNRGAAVILEVWDLDSIAGGNVKLFLDTCGVKVYSDWTSSSNLSLWPLIPDHPILHYPNDGISMRNTAPFWTEDHGDLLETTGKGDAQLILGTNPTLKNDHATLAVCLDGRLIIQTFRSHDFGRIEIESLWENYIYYALRSKFENNPD